MSWVQVATVAKFYEQYAIIDADTYARCVEASQVTFNRLPATAADERSLRWSEAFAQIDEHFIDMQKAALDRQIALLSAKIATLVNGIKNDDTSTVAALKGANAVESKLMRAMFAKRHSKLAKTLRDIDAIIDQQHDNFAILASASAPASRQALASFTHYSQQALSQLTLHCRLELSRCRQAIDACDVVCRHHALPPTSNGEDILLEALMSM